MEEHKNLYRLADELHDLIDEAKRTCPPACDEALKEAGYFVYRALEQLELLLPVEVNNAKN